MLIYLERVVQLISGFAITYLLVNNFQADEYGVYKYILSIASLLVMASLLGLNAANIRFIPEYIAKNNAYAIDHQVAFYFLIQMVVFALISISGVALISLGVVDIDDRIIIAAVLLIAFLNYLKSYFGESIHIAFSERQQLTNIRIILNMVQLGIICLFITTIDSNIEQLQYVLVIYSSIEVIVLLCAVRIFYRPKMQLNLKNNKEIKKTFGYASYNYGFTWVNFLRDNAATTIMVAYLFSYKEVAYYSIALIIPNIIRNFTPSKVFSGLLMPMYVREYITTGKDSKVFEGMGLMAKLNLIYILPASMYAIYLYQWVVSKYFGYEYSESTYLLSLYLFANVAVLSYVDIGAVLLNTFNKADILFKVNIASVTNILFLIAFHGFGMQAIGIANLASTMLTVLLLFVTVAKIYGTQVATGLGSLYLISYALFVLIGFYLLFLLGEIVFLTLAPLYSTLAIFLILRGPYFDDGDKLTIRKALPKPIGDKIYG